MAAAESAARESESVIKGHINGDIVKSPSASHVVQGESFNTHSASIEDVADESEVNHPEQPKTSSSVLEDKSDNVTSSAWVPPTSNEAAGKEREVEQPAPAPVPIPVPIPVPASVPALGAALSPAKKQDKTIDTQSREVFPELGGASKSKQAASLVPIWGSQKSVSATTPMLNAKTNSVSTNGASRASTPNSGAATPSSISSQQAPRLGPQSIALPGRHQERISLEPSQMLPRNQMRRPLPDILKDINKRFKASVTMSTGAGGVIWLSASGPEIACRNALYEVVTQIGSKQAVQVLVPKSAIAYIIGKGGAKIKEIKEKTGARIQVQKQEDAPSPVDEDDDVMVAVLIEGNAITAESARKEVLKIASERTTTINTKLRGIPAEFYPFLAGPHDAHANALHPSPPPPGQAPNFLPAIGDNHITLAGERAAVQIAKAEIERRVEELRRQLILDQFPLNRGRHQFIIGQQGISPHQFFAETGCGIILPGDVDDDTITIIGPSDRIQSATDRAMELATEMHSHSFDISRLHRDAPRGAAMHARDVTRYLGERKEIERLENLHKAHIVTPITHEGTAGPWELYSRDGKNAIRAQAEIEAIIKGHPPSRMVDIPIDPFFHHHIRTDICSCVKQQYGVHVVVPTSSENDNVPVLLVYEGPTGLQPEFRVPRGAPASDEVETCKQALEDARNHILSIINAQAEITSQSIDVPQVFHKKLRDYIKQEQQNRSTSDTPVRITASGTTVSLRGPGPAVQTLAAKVDAFVEQAIQDEKQRGFTTSLEFPQKHANQLVGKGGSNILGLRDRYDVDIQINEEGKVVIKGPPAKANAAKAHIAALGRQWADETTYTLKIEPKYHGELIGAQGAQINKLQTRYKVQIYFPQSARPGRDDHNTADVSSEAGRKTRREQEPDEVLIKGPKKGADDARDEILSLLQYLKDTSYTATVTVQQSQVPSLIGQRGSGMDELRQTTGAKIDIPNARDARDTSGNIQIQIKGTKAQVTQAKKLIEEKKEVFDHTVTRTLEVEKKHHRALIGHQGSTIRDIVLKAGGSDDRRELARTVQFPKTENEGSAVKIVGSKDVVDKVVAAMQKIVADRDNQSTETLEVPAHKHRSLIGRGGEIKKDLEQRFTVSIDIPRQGNGTAVRITGLPNDIENAKAHITSLTQEHARSLETIDVPKNLHHTIADHGQLFRKLRHDHHVTVDHAGEKPPPRPSVPITSRNNGTSSLPLITDDANKTASSFQWFTTSNTPSEVTGTIPWTIRGSPEAIANAKTLLEAAIKLASTHTTTGYLTLPEPKAYRYVIGRGGENVQKIRSATGCTITVPGGGGEGPIVVEGSEGGVEKARESILESVREGGGR